MLPCYGKYSLARGTLLAVA